MGELDEIIDSLRQLEKDAGKRVAEKAATTLLETVKTTLAAGTSPDGTPWAPRKEGGRAYAHAAGKLTSKAYGNLVQLTLTGPEVYGHFGARGMPVRQMIPDAGGGMPPSVENALKKAAREAFEELTK